MTDSPSPERARGERLKTVTVTTEQLQCLFGGKFPSECLYTVGPGDFAVGLDVSQGKTGKMIGAERLPHNEWRILGI